MAVARGQGAEIWNPLGVTMLGGLTVSSLLSLLFIPVIYHALEARSLSKKSPPQAPGAGHGWPAKGQGL